MKKNIFVIGPDSFNMQQLKSLRNAADYNFHPLLAHREVKNRDHYDIQRLLLKAKKRLDRFSGKIDAIVSYWDFPVSSMLPLLRQYCGLVTPTLASVAKCEHKYWSRLEQYKIIPECTPKFCSINPFKHPQTQIDLDFPFWIKPVKSLRSYLAFRINNAKELNTAIALIRMGIGRIAHPFNYFLDHIEIPFDLAGVDGTCCIAEEPLYGRQCTLEGYVFHGKIHIYGAVDSVRLANRTTFARYEYPSKLPKKVIDRMRAACGRFIRHIGFDNAPFNMEFFYNRKLDRISILEVNPRQSQSHSKLFEKVDGASNHEVMIDIALGKEPDLPSGGGTFKRAAKFLLHHPKDAVVQKVPDEDDLARVKTIMPDIDIEICIKEGMRLSQLYDQDSYNYEIANIYIGTRNPKELLSKHKECLKRLNFKFSGIPPRVGTEPLHRSLERTEIYA